VRSLRRRCPVGRIRARRRKQRWETIFSWKANLAWGDMRLQGCHQRELFRSPGTGTGDLMPLLWPRAPDEPIHRPPIRVQQWPTVIIGERPTAISESRQNRHTTEQLVSKEATSPF
jgi:hypothetical protein